MRAVWLQLWLVLLAGFLQLFVCCSCARGPGFNSRSSPLDPTQCATKCGTPTNGTRSRSATQSEARGTSWCGRRLCRPPLAAADKNAEQKTQRPAKRVHSSVVRAADCRSAGPWLKSGCALLQLSRLWRAGGARCSGRGLQAAGHDQLDGVLSGVLLACLPCPGCLPQRCGRRSVRKLDTLGIEPRAFRMRSGCDTTKPCAHLVEQVLYVVAMVRSQLSGRGRNRRRASVCDTLHALARVATRRFRSQPPGIEGTLAEWLRRRPAKPAPAKPAPARTCAMLPAIAKRERLSTCRVAAKRAAQKPPTQRAQRTVIVARAPLHRGKAPGGQLESSHDRAQGALRSRCT